MANSSRNSTLTIHGRSLPDSHRPPQGIKDRLANKAAQSIAALFGIPKPGQQIPFPALALFSPHVDSLRFGSTHFGIMIPDLPAPHQFMSFASILGMLGVKIVDVDHAVSSDGPRHTALLVHGTAQTPNDAFSSYGMKTDMDIKADGSLIRFGKDAELSGVYPNFKLKSQRDGFSTDINLTATGDITWFGHSPFYQHFSLLIRYDGTFTHHGKSIPITGLCTWEYWQAVSLYLPVNKLIPRRFKLGADFFTYQVINLNQETQLLLAYVAFLDRPLAKFAYIRTVGGGSQQLDADVRFKVLTAQAEPAIAPDGFAMTLPQTFRWTITSRTGESLFEINATVDTPMLYGLAAGYVGAYHWEGTRNGQPLTGRGYVEYIDQRD
ncbi:DUF6670 family protein [Aquirhabdus sp.]|uniref:DUF6670 family protein n=1 Tax=Aquirhabdus sp. TaxID=2824160 RepID=UPI00396CB8DD